MMLNLWEDRQMWIEGQCPICERAFRTRRRRQVFCSRECANEKTRLYREDERLRAGAIQHRREPAGPDLETLLERLLAARRVAAGKADLERCALCRRMFHKKCSHHRFCTEACRRAAAVARRPKRGTAMPLRMGAWGLSLDLFATGQAALVGAYGVIDRRKPDAVAGF